jgi:hypothetical protein
MKCDTCQYRDAGIGNPLCSNCGTLNNWKWYRADEVAVEIQEMIDDDYEDWDERITLTGAQCGR